MALARKVLDAVLERWTEDSRALTKEYQWLVEENNQYRETIKDMNACINDLERQLSVYENRSSPAGKATISSGKTKKHNRRSPPS